MKYLEKKTLICYNLSINKMRMENKMSGIVWVITASIVFICIAVVAIFYKLTKLQEETREAYLKFDSYRMENGTW